MIPIWLMIAQGVKKIADNQNKQIDDFNKNQQYTPNGQLGQGKLDQGKPMNNVDMTGDSGGGLGNAFSTFSSIYGNYLDSSRLDDEKKKKLFKQ